MEQQAAVLSKVRGEPFEYVSRPPSLLERLSAPEQAAMVEFLDSPLGGKVSSERAKSAMSQLRERYGHKPCSWEEWCTEQLQGERLGATRSLSYGTLGALAVALLAISTALLSQTLRDR